MKYPFDMQFTSFIKEYQQQLMLGVF